MLLFYVIQKLPARTHRLSLKFENLIGNLDVKTLLKMINKSDQAMQIGKILNPPNFHIPPILRSNVQRLQFCKTTLHKRLQLPA